MAAIVTVELDGNPDGNAMNPQRLVITKTDGAVIERTINATLGSLDNPMDAEQAAGKYGLCQRLAGPNTDKRLFEAPLAYATERS